MKVNIGTYSFGGIASYLGLGPTLLEKFQTIKSLGYDGVELLPVDLDNDVEDIKKWAAETGLEIVSIHAKPTEDIQKGRDPGHQFEYPHGVGHYAGGFRR